MDNDILRILSIAFYINFVHLFDLFIKTEFCIVWVYFGYKSRNYICSFCCILIHYRSKLKSATRNTNTGGQFGKPIRQRAKSQLALASYSSDTEKGLSDQTKASSWPLLNKAGKKEPDPDEVTLTCGQSLRHLFKRLLPIGRQVRPESSHKSSDKLNHVGSKQETVQMTNVRGAVPKHETTRKFKRKSKVVPIVDG